jgi:ATP-dependent Zn protease
MVTQLGFSKKLGQVAWSGGGGNSFLGQSMAQPSDFSMKTADEVDAEVKDLVERAYRWVCGCVCTGWVNAAGCAAACLVSCLGR